MAAIFGRERELASIESVVVRGLGGAGALLLLSGEPGIGKTLLAERAADLASAAGAEVAWGRCWEAGGAPAYWPWIQAFRRLGIADSWSRSEAGEAPADARFRVADRAVQALAERARRRPLALVLDDLHAADLPSLLLLQLLARELRGQALVVIGTYREVEARRDRDLAPVLAKLERDAELLLLERLSPSDVAAWLADSAHAARPDEVYSSSEGNPLFVRELLRLGHRAHAGQLPAGMTGVLDEHLARVSGGTRAVLEQAAVLGREFGALELAALSGVSPAALHEALDEAKAADLVSGDGGPRLSFAHMLVRDRLVDSLSPARRAELYCRAAEVVIETRADLVAGAHLMLAGHAGASLERLLDVVQGAAERCLLDLGFEAAVELGEQALALVSLSTPSRPVCSLLVVVAEAHLRAGDLARGRRRCLEAASMARALGESSLAARAALAYGAHLLSATVDPVMVELLEGALAQQGEHDHPLRARLLARLSAALVPPRPADISRVIELGQGGVAMARRLGDDETLLSTLQYAASGFGYLIGSEERLALAGEIVTLAERLRNRAVQVQVLGIYAVGLLEEGRQSEAMATYERYERLLDAFPQPAYQWRRFANACTLAALRGDRAGALAAAEGLHRYALEHGLRSALLAWCLSRISLAHAWGDLADIADAAGEILSLLAQVPTLSPYAAWVLTAVGRSAEARAKLEAIAKDTSSFPWLIVAGDTVVLLRAADLAAQFYEALGHHRFQNRLFWGPAASFGLGPTSRILGELALLLGRPRDALAHFEDALAVAERIGAVPFIELSRRARDAAQAALTTAAVAEQNLALRREGDVWAVEWRGQCVRLKDGKGLRYLEHLVSCAGQDVHVLELIGSEERPADAGALLDSKAKDQYRRRLEDLKDQLEEGTTLGDRGRVERAQAEIDAIAEALAAAVGLGGRDRVAASNVEKARINVQRRLRDTVERIAQQNLELSRLIEGSLRTGAWCSFRAAERT